MTSRWASYEPDAGPGSSSLPADLRIRVAKVGDCPPVARIQAERDGIDLIAAEAGCRAGLADPDRLLLVAEIAGEIVGFGRVARYVSPEEGAWTAPAGWYLAGLIVRDAWRRHGIGAELTRRRLDWIRERARTAYYFANARNLASLDLHRALGFEEVTRDFRMPWADFEGGVGVLCRIDLGRRDPTPDRGSPA